MIIFKRLLLLLPLALLLVPSSAFAETASSQWTISSVSRPTNFKPGGDREGDEYVVLVTNTGAGSNTEIVEKGESGEHPVPVPVTVSDELPEGLEALPGATAVDELGVNGTKVGGPTAGANFSDACASSGEGIFSCTYSGVVAPGDTLILDIPVTVAASPPDSCEAVLLGKVQLPASALSCVENVVRVSGGGAPAPAIMRTPTMISQSPAGFGLSPGGESTALSSVQAGAHPNITTAVAFDTQDRSGATAGNLKNTITDEPAGFALDLRDTPSCLASVFLIRDCPVPTQVGVTTITLDISGVSKPELEPVYNLAPEPGEIGKIGFSVGTEFHYEGDIAVRPPGEAGEYGGRVTFYDSTAGIDNIDNISLTLWGVPAAKIHDPLRWATPEFDLNSNHGLIGGNVFGVSSDAPPVPFFSNPSSCGPTPLAATFAVTSWQAPEQVVGLEGSPEPAPMPFGPIVGCDRLGMEPQLSAEATTNKAGAASGLDLNVNIPQTYDNAEGLATSALEKQVVTLPEGMTVNPSSGAGLAACTPAQYAQEGVQYVEGRGCPKESKLGEVEITTPLLEEHAKGSVYLATPYDNPFPEGIEHPNGSLLALYIVARIPNRGVLIKAPGDVQANPVTGQLVTTFDTSNPEHPGDGLAPLPFSLLTFKFNQGAGAPLVTPPTCGLYTVTAQLTPWSTLSGEPPSSEGLPLTPPLAPFPITTGNNGGPCPAGGTPPFAPGVTAGTENNDAGSYSALNIRLTRNDGEQEITGFASQLPPGLTANLSGVPFCPTEDIESARVKSGAQEESEPSCPAASEIGQTVADAGVGSVLAQAPGQIYMAGPYQGAPFSVVAITRAKVGPFDLGTVVVHLPLDINPETAAVTIPAGTADQIPHIIKGIVVHVREIRVYINKHDFTLNPTSCNPFNFSATVIGGGADPANPADNNPVTATTPFRVTACQALKFVPKFAASTAGKTSRANGASLHVGLSYPAGALGQDSNIKEVKVDLPKQLPSRLTTLQKACTAAQFSANPAGCPAASIIGYAKAVTPILPVPLEGPAYFVSHGGEAFPELEIVLQGYGFTIVLTGNTFISHAGITSSTFHTIPDEPVGSFELTLPEGKFSALAANGNLCAVTKTVTVKKTVTEKVHGRSKRVVKKTAKTIAEPLVMPTAFVGQNGAETHKSTPVSVTGCPKIKKIKKAKKHKKPGKGKKARN
jgi:hypothetical protein